MLDRAIPRLPSLSWCAPTSLSVKQSWNSDGVRHSWVEGLGPEEGPKWAKSAQLQTLVQDEGALCSAPNTHRPGCDSRSSSVLTLQRDALYSDLPALCKPCLPPLLNGIPPGTTGSASRPLRSINDTPQSNQNPALRVSTPISYSCYQVNIHLGEKKTPAKPVFS